MDVAPEALPNPETGKLALFGPEHGFWVPPEAKLVALPPPRNPQEYVFRDGEDIEDRDVPAPCIVYPVPSHWRPELTPGEARALRELYGVPVPIVGNPSIVAPEAEVLLRINWQIDWGPRVSRIDGAELEAIGWRRQTEPKGMLRDFLDLAQDPITSRTQEAVRAFAEQWGPLWLCRNREHQDCHWVPWGHPGWSWSPCLWAPCEEVREFVRKAWQAQVVVAVGAALQQNQPAPAHLWPYLRRVLSPAYEVLPEQCSQDVAMQRQVLTAVVNRYLAGSLGAFGGPRLWMLWERDRASPSLYFHSGFGFLSAVWIGIAQALSDRHGMLQCDGCHVFYVRTGRRPKKGQKNYCDGCRKTGPKRQWWRTHRGVHHQQA
jgi:hypothetical protein